MKTNTGEVYVNVPPTSRITGEPGFDGGNHLQYPSGRIIGMDVGNQEEIMSRFGHYQDKYWQRVR